MVTIGYGVFKNYRVEEVSDAFLTELAGRYRLSYSAHVFSGEDELRITIAVQEEVRRRSGGGKAMPRELSARELAHRLVAKGFQQLSKECHPDVGGTNTAQERLNRVRHELLEACAAIDDREREGALVIREPALQEFSGMTITDDDIPF